MNPRDWIGRSETVSDVVTASPYAALSATLDRPAARPPPGTPLPALWHWLYFLPLHRQSEIGPDGHARRGDFCRRCRCPAGCGRAAGSNFGQPLRIGDALTRSSTIDGVPRRRAAAGRWCSSRCGTRYAAGPSRTPCSPNSTTSSIARADAAGRRAAADAGAGACRLGTTVGSGRRAAVPLFGTDLQRPPHPLRSPPCDRGRRVSGTRRPRPAHRDAVSISCAGSCRMRRSPASNSGRCGRCSTSIRSSSAASRSRTGGRSGSGRGREGALAMEASAATGR